MENPHPWKVTRKNLNNDLFICVIATLFWDVANKEAVKSLIRAEEAVAYHVSEVFVFEPTG